MTTIVMEPRVTSFAPQFLVDDLERSITYYNKLGFAFGEPWDNFYAIGQLNGLELHIKEAPKNQAERRWRRDNEHLDAAASTVSKHFTNSALPTASRSSSRSQSRPGARRTSTSKTPTATSSPSAAPRRRGRWNHATTETDRLPGFSVSPRAASAWWRLTALACRG